MVLRGRILDLNKHNDGQGRTPDVDDMILETFLFDVYGPHDARFERGDSNADDQVNVADAIHSIDMVLHGRRLPRCQDAADANDDGRIDVSDVVATLWAVFTGDGPLPSAAARGRGFDHTPDDLFCFDEPDDDRD